MTAGATTAVPWSPEALTRWRASTSNTVDAQEHDAAALAFGVYADVLADPPRFEAAYRAGATTWPVTRDGRSLVGESLSPEGIRATAEALRAARAAGDRATAARLEWRLAMINAVEDLADSTIDGEGSVRNAGLAPLTAVVFVVGVLGAAVVAREISLAIREPAAARLRALEIAGEAAARRYARAAASPGMPVDPPTPVETAVQEDVRQRADSELEKAARGATGLVIAGALAAGLYLLFQARKKG